MGPVIQVHGRLTFEDYLRSGQRKVPSVSSSGSLGFIVIVKCDRMVDKAELLQEGNIFLIHLFARAILLMKKLKIEETKATYRLDG